MIKQDLDKGQHFLINGGIIKKEIEVSNLLERDKVIEIGAGTGNLTKEIVKNVKELLAFEIDERFRENLEKIKKGDKNLKIIYGNALEYDWNGFNKIVSNIPYSLSEPVLIKAIKSEIKELILIVGESFKEILSDNQTKIGIITNLFFEINYIMKVDKESFDPPPRTNSWLIKLKRKDKPTRIETLLQQITLKNRKIKNAIIYSLVSEGKTKNQAREIIKRIKINNEALEKPTSRITGKFLIKLRKELGNLIS